MADSKISQLTSATTPLAGTEVLPIVQSGATKQVSIDNLTAGRNFSAGTITANIIVPTVAEFPDGTAAAPSITNTGDTDTGMYFPAANAVSLVTAGVNRLRINSAGDVGIGTITPGARLDVRGSATFNEDGANVDFRVEGDTDANLFFVDASADAVGIGTATPTQKLTVAGTITTTQGNTITSNNLAGNAFSLVSNSDANAGSSSSVLLWNNNGLSASSAALSFFSTASSVSNELRLSNGAAAPITFYTNGSERVRIDSSGNVGIGTATPASKLDVNGTITATGFSVSTLTVTGNTYLATTSGNVGIGTSSPANKLHVTGTGSTPTLFERTGSNGVYLQLKDASGASVFLGADNGLFAVQTPGSSYSNKLVVDSSGNVGIGTSSPGAPLTVYNGAAGADVAYLLNGSGFGLRIQPQTGGGGTNTLAYVSSGESLSLGTNNTERMRITSTGDVGIGTSSPAAKLGVTGNAVFSGGVGGTPFIAFAEDQLGSTPAYWQWNATTGLSTFYTTNASSANGTFNWFTAGAERMRIDSSGNVGIGTSGPAYTLDVRTSASNAIRVGSNSNAFGSLLSWDNPSGESRLMSIGAYALVFGTNTTERMRIDSSGNVGVGTSSPDAKLRVNGTAKVGEGVASNTSKLMVNTVSGVAAGIQLFQDANESWIIQNPASTTALTFGNSGTERMRLDSAGNLGLGVTPSAWSTNRRALQIGGGDVAALGLAAQYSEIAHNTISTVSGPQYATSNPAAVVDFNNAAAGGFAWRIAPSGTAGNAISFTQAMTLDSSGNLGLGTSSPAYKLDVLIGAGSGSLFRAGQSGVSNGYTITSNGSALTHFWATTGEAMRLDASGNLGLGVTPSAWGGNYKAFDFLFGSIANTNAGNVDVAVTQNAFFNGSNWITKYTGQSKRYVMSDDGHIWFNGASQTAGNAISFTQAMTLDASGNLLVGQTSSISGKLQISGAGGIRINEDGAGTKVVFLRSDYAGLGPAIQVSTADPLLFLTNNTERMRITSPGDVGIGTSSPATKLHVNTGAAGYGITVAANTQTSITYQIGIDSSSNLAIYDSFAAAKRLVLDTSGNLGLGVTPSAWSTQNAVEFSYGAFSAGTAIGTLMASNAFYNGTNWIYRISSAAMRYTQDSAGHSWFTAPFGTAGNAISFTQAMTLDASGNLGVGTSSPNTRLEVSGAEAIVSLRVNTANSGISASNYSEIQLSDLGAVRAFWRNLRDGSGKTAFAYNNHLAFLSDGGGAPTERMRITSAGDVGIGTASPAQKLTVSGGNLFVSNNTAGSATALVSNSDATAGSNAGLLLWNNNGFSATAGSLYFYSSTSSVPNELRLANGGAAPITFYTNGSERMRLDSTGRLLVGTASAAAQTPSGSIQYAVGAHIASGGFGRLWVPGQQIGAAAYAGLYGLATTYNAYYSGGWKSLGGGTGGAITIDEGIFAFSNTNSVVAADQALTWTNRLVIDTSGNVGVGTSSPANLLHVNGSNSIARFSGSSTSLSAYQTFFNNSAAQAYFGIESSTGTGIIGTGAAYGMVLSTASTNPLAFGTNNAERARIDASGNLLVGTTSTSALTAFSGSAGGQVIQSGVPVLALVDSDDTTNGVVWLANSYGVGYLYTKAANPFIFGTNGVEKMRLTEAGNLLLGKTASAYATTNRTCLEIAGTSTALIEVKGGTSNYYIYNDGTNLFQVLSNAGAQVFYTNNAESMRVTATGNMQTIGGIYDANVIRIANPKGAHYVTTSASISGAIKIVLPVGGSNTMIRMTVRIYEYATGYSFDMHLGGYNYNDISYTWYNVYAYAVGSPSINRQFSVRFGYDSVAGKNVIYIGELSSSWAYPQVYVTDVQLGYSGYSDTWAYNWSIGFETSAFAGVTQTITNPQIGYQAVAGDAVQGSVKYTSTTNTAGCFYGGTTTPTGTNRLNYSGYLYPTFLNLEGSADTSTAATHYFVETGNDGYVRPKTLANVQTEIVTSAAVSAALGGAIAFGSGTAAAPSIYPTGDTNTGFFFPAADTIGMSTGGVERVRVVDSAVGIGITPSARSTNFYGLQVAYASMEGSTSQPDAWFSANARYDSSWKYIASNFASIYEQTAGRHSFSTTTSGTAGNAITFSEVFRVGADKHVYTQGGSDKGYKSSSDVAWTSFTLQNSYTQNTTTPFQYRRVGNMVEIHGVFEKTAGCGFAEVVAALPSGLRPTDFMYVVGTSFSDNAPLGLATTFEIAPASGNIFISLPLASGANYKGGFSVTFTCIS